MAQPLTKFSTRRYRNIACAAVAAVLLAFLLRQQNIALHNAAFTSGWVLLLIMIFLALYNGRKKLPFLPLARSAAWLQWHLYLGLITLLLFPLHIQFRIPNGILESALALLFLIVAGSGVVGIALSRSVPKRLSIRGEEIIFERIPAFRASLRDKARALALQSVATSDAPTLGDYYARRLAHFFERPRHYWYHVLQSARPRHKLLAEIADLDRYLSPPERDVARQLTDLVCKKDDLDYSRALQLTLKGWLFLHIGFTYSLLMLAIVHAVIAHAFKGTMH